MLREQTLPDRDLASDICSYTTQIEADKFYFFSKKIKRRVLDSFTCMLKNTEYLCQIPESYFHKDIVMSTIFNNESSSVNHWHLYTVVHPVGTVLLHTLKLPEPRNHVKLKTTF